MHPADRSIPAPWSVVHVYESAYVYARFAGHWWELARLMASDGSVGDLFGASVAIRKAVIVVGAPNADLGLPDEDGVGPPRGNVYVFLPYRQGWSFQLPQEVARYEGLIPDIDMAGRQVILSRHDAGVFNDYVRGNATLYRFGRISPTAAQE